MHKAVIITGANRGLGFQAARALIARPEGWKVILAVRDVPAGHTAAARLGAPHRTEVLECNLASLASVRQAAAKLTDRDDVAGALPTRACSSLTPAVTPLMVSNSPSAPTTWATSS